MIQLFMHLNSPPSVKIVLILATFRIIRKLANKVVRAAGGSMQQQAL